MARKRRRRQRLKVVHLDCAGFDIGKDRHFVAVDPERVEEPVREFGAFTRDLDAMAEWLKSCGVTKVAMESTSVYWIPVYEVPERAGFEVMLVPPRMMKQIGGRKSDVLDCKWIWQLMSYGLLRGAFRPGDAVCPLRSYVRQARRLIEDRSRCVQQMQKALTEMNVRLDSVISDITGKTGERILRAIVAGERDPERLASFRDSRIRASADMLTASLQGTWRDEHLFTLEQAMQRCDFLKLQIEDCEARIMAEIEQLTPTDDPPDGGTSDDGPQDCGTGTETSSNTAGKTLSAQDKVMAQALREMMGGDLTAIPTIGVTTALVIASEIGPDFSAFPSAQHFCSWLGVAPGTRISGGQTLAGPVAQGGQSGWTSFAHVSHVGPQQPDIHRRETPGASRPNGYSDRDHCHRTGTCLPDLPDGHAGRGICGEGHGGLRGAAPKPSLLTPRSAGSEARLQAGSAEQQRRKNKNDAISSLGVCYSRGSPGASVFASTKGDHG